jgi:hypothetical protein
MIALISRFFLIGVVLILAVGGCSSVSPQTLESTLPPSPVIDKRTPSVAAPPTIPGGVLSVRPDVFMTNDSGLLPLPTSGYELYVVGEPHGEREVRLLALEYLQLLHEHAGVRDIVLEQVSPAYEQEVNAYVLGLSDTVSDEWSFVADVVIGVRVFNDGLPHGEKVRVHLTDLDLGLPNIYAHLQILQEEMGPVIEDARMPSLPELGSWEEEEMLALVDRLVGLAGDREAVVAGLETVADSVRWHFIGRQSARGKLPASEYVNYVPVREGRIARNVQRLLEELHNRPVLALYGGYHAQKQPALVASLHLSSQPVEVFLDTPSWVQRVMESGIRVHSILAMGISGHEGVMGKYQRPVERDPEEIRFADGVTVADVFSTTQEYDIVYVDLRVDGNHSLRLGNSYQDIPAGEVYDGVVFFREVHPLEWQQYP